MQISGICGEISVIALQTHRETEFQVMEWLRGPLNEWAKKQQVDKIFQVVTPYPDFFLSTDIVFSCYEKYSLLEKDQHALPDRLFPEWLKIKGRNVQKHQRYRANLFSSKCENRSKAGILGPNRFKKEVLFCFNRDICRHVELSLIQGKHWNNKLLPFACTFLMWRSQVPSKRSMWMFYC